MWLVSELERAKRLKLLWLERVEEIPLDNPRVDGPPNGFLVGDISISFPLFDHRNYAVWDLDIGYLEIRSLDIGHLRNLMLWACMAPALDILSFAQLDLGDFVVPQIQYPMWSRLKKRKLT